MNRPQEVYEQRRSRQDAAAQALGRRSRQLGNGRLVAFLLALAAFLAPVFTGGPSGPWTVGMIAFLVIFLGLVVVHARVERARATAALTRRLNEEAIHRLERNWPAMPEPRWRLEESPPFARDLDLFGRASLWKLLGTVSTPMGKETLATWLLEPAPPAEIRSRQQAVRELTPRLDLRQDLELSARSLRSREATCQAFLNWAEDVPWLASRRPLQLAAVVLPAVGLILIALAFAGWLPHHFWILWLVGNFGFATVAGRGAGAIFSRVSAREGEFRQYSRALELLETRLIAGTTDRSQDSRLDLLHQALGAQGRSASQQMERLQRLVALSDVRYSGTIHGLLQGLLLWDFQVLRRLEAWQAEAGPAARRWLETLGEVEALCALAGLAFDQPRWSYPEIVEPRKAEERRLEAQGLGHPLLGESARVVNDVRVGPEGTFLLITGSNMSGKSTLIRSLGLNAVLAQAGGPVCAESLRLPPVELGTSVLVEDSLEDGVSFFMAELRRVKEIVDLAAASRQRGRTLLYLMDEILRGTNTFERQAAVRKVLVHLLREGAIGAIATHDLMLAEIDELAGASRPVHFRETLGSADGKPTMSFDYRLRPGVATTRNALKLLELVGLEN